eukprot:scaffold128423_cov66-Phaeocystis_antarctica.AAC.5
MRVVESPKNTSHRPASCRVRQAGVRHGASCAECRSSKRASSGSVQSQSRLPACQVSSRRGCGWPPHCRLPTGVAAPGGSRSRSYAEMRPDRPCCIRPRQGSSLAVLVDCMSRHCAGTARATEAQCWSPAR